MLDWQFGFFEMLGLIFCSYFIGGLFTEVKIRMGELNASKQHVISINVNKIGDVWYAFEENTNKFIIQASTYEELQDKLHKIGSNAVYIADETKLKSLLEESKDAI